MSVLVDLGVPALAGTALLATLPLIDPGVRWSRRLRNDIQIAAGLTHGVEKDRWDVDIAQRARELREYREAFSPAWTLGRYAFFAYGVACVGYLVWPPGWKEWMALNGIPGIPLALVIGITALEFFLAVFNGVGFSFQSPEAILRQRRNQPHHRRLGKVRRLDKKRKRAIKDGRHLRPRGSRLGFEAWRNSEDYLEAMKRVDER